MAPGVIENWKYMGSRFWSHDDIEGHGHVFKAKVILTMHLSASQPELSGHFRASLKAGQFRAIV